MGARKGHHLGHRVKCLPFRRDGDEDADAMKQIGQWGTGVAEGLIGAVKAESLRQRSVLLFLVRLG